MIVTLPVLFIGTFPLQRRTSMSVASDSTELSGKYLTTIPGVALTISTTTGRDAVFGPLSSPWKDAKPLQGIWSRLVLVGVLLLYGAGPLLIWAGTSRIAGCG